MKLKAYQLRLNCGLCFMPQKWSSCKLCFGLSFCSPIENMLSQMHSTRCLKSMVTEVALKEVNYLSTLCLKKKLCKLVFVRTSSNLHIFIIFGREMAKRVKLYEAHSFSTSPNSRHHATVLNADVPECYRTLKVDICNKLFNDLAYNKLKCGLFSTIISSDIVRLKIVRNCVRIA